MKVSKVTEMLNNYIGINKACRDNVISTSFFLYNLNLASFWVSVPR